MVDWSATKVDVIELFRSVFVDGAVLSRTIGSGVFRWLAAQINRKFIARMHVMAYQYDYTWIQKYCICKFFFSSFVRFDRNKIRHHLLKNWCLDHWCVLHYMMVLDLRGHSRCSYHRSYSEWVKRKKNKKKIRTNEKRKTNQKHICIMWFTLCTVKQSRWRLQLSFVVKKKKKENTYWRFNIK